MKQALCGFFVAMDQDLYEKRRGLRINIHPCASLRCPILLTSFLGLIWVKICFIERPSIKPSKSIKHIFILISKEISRDIYFSGI
jgi:hypothetical protein